MYEEDIPIGPVQRCQLEHVPSSMYELTHCLLGLDWCFLDYSEYQNDILTHEEYGQIMQVLRDKYGPTPTPANLDVETSQLLRGERDMTLLVLVLSKTPKPFEFGQERATKGTIFEGLDPKLTAKYTRNILAATNFYLDKHGWDGFSPAVDHLPRESSWVASVLLRAVAGAILVDESCSIQA